MKTEDDTIKIKLSKQLVTYTNNMNINCNKFETRVCKSNYWLCQKDRNYIKKLNLNKNKPLPPKNLTNTKGDVVVNLSQLRQIFDYIQMQNNACEKKTYFHELFKGSEIVLPRNLVVPRSKQLMERCKLLEEHQRNLEYNKMTKNVDGIRRRYPEDTFSYHFREMNKYLIAVLQVVLSAATGFVFGFTGIELISSFRSGLLAGIFCCFLFGLAELYFLARKLHT